MLFTVGVLLLMPGRARAELPTADEVSAVRVKLDEAEQALESHKAQLSENDRAQLSEKLAGAKAALKQYVELTTRGDARRTTTTPLYAAGGTLLLDDASGIGAADDVLLPFVAFGLLAAHLSTKAPATRLETELAWANTISQLRLLAMAAAAIQAAQACSCVCFKHGIGPLPIGKTPNPLACANLCKNHEQRYNGYQCGGRGVTWF